VAVQPLLQLAGRLQLVTAQVPNFSLLHYFDGFNKVC